MGTGEMGTGEMGTGEMGAGVTLNKRGTLVRACLFLFSRSVAPARSFVRRREQLRGGRGELRLFR